MVERSTDRDLTWREAVAALLMLLATGFWILMASREPTLVRKLAWGSSAVFLLLGAWGVVRGVDRVTTAVRRSAWTLAIVFAGFLALPLPTKSGTISTFGMRAGYLAPPLLWSLCLALVLTRRPVPVVPDETKPPEPTSKSPKRQRRRRNRRRARTN